jgi:uncharacterized membrane protein YqhA
MNAGRRKLGEFLLANRRWVLVPVFVALLLVGLLVALSIARPASPFIYPTF